MVNKIRYAVKRKLGLKKVKVGHAGTLDPLATGLLIIAVGKATKNIESYMGLPKEYTGKITLGATTPSYDLETTPDAFFPLDHITSALLLETALKMVGEQQQTPPLFSAKKIDGKKAYLHARKGDEITLKSNTITIHNFTITEVNLPHVSFKINCSKGTYIRSIAHDFGKMLNSGAHLSELRRTKIGHYAVEESTTVNQIISLLQND